MGSSRVHLPLVLFWQSSCSAAPAASPQVSALASHGLHHCPAAAPHLWGPNLEKAAPEVLREAILESTRLTLASEAASLQPSQSFTDLLTADLQAFEPGADAVKEHLTPERADDWSLGLLVRELLTDEQSIQALTGLTPRAANTKWGDEGGSDRLRKVLVSTYDYRWVRIWCTCSGSVHQGYDSLGKLGEYPSLG